MTTIVIVIFACGFGLGLLVAAPFYFRVTKAGTLVIDQTDSTKDTYSFELEKGLNDLPKCTYISMKVKVVKDESA